MTVRSTRVHGNGAVRLTIDHPRGNILDAETIGALHHHLTAACSDVTTRAIVIDAAGRDFSFGASVQEHLPATVKAMLQKLHGLFFAMVEAPVPVLVAVHGRCLGGAMELALCGSRIIASHGAAFAQPEIKLGVFAPAASVLLQERLGSAVAEDLLVTGRTVSADEGLTLGLVDEISKEQPAAHALTYVTQHFSGISLNGLRHAVRAARKQKAELLKLQLPRLEQLYLDELMMSPDPVEGLQAFIDSRPPRWTEAR
jgi:cyclohexa-1,5-dienecarbonyl-CoA hydratase